MREKEAKTKHMIIKLQKKKKKVESVLVLKHAVIYFFRMLLILRLFFNFLSGVTSNDKHLYTLQNSNHTRTPISHFKDFHTYTFRVEPT